MTTVTFEQLGRFGRQVVELDGHAVAFDVVDAVVEHLTPLAGGRALDVVVDLPDDAHSGRVYLTLGALPAGVGEIRVSEPEAPPTTYLSGDVVHIGDVVRIGGYGSVLHEVMDVQIGLARIRATTGTYRVQTVPAGRLTLVERYRGRQP